MYYKLVNTGSAHYYTGSNLQLSSNEKFLPLELVSSTFTLVGNMNKISSLLHEINYDIEVFVLSSSLHGVFSAHRVIRFTANYFSPFYLPSWS